LKFTFGLVGSTIWACSPGARSTIAPLPSATFPVWSTSNGSASVRRSFSRKTVSMAFIEAAVNSASVYCSILNRVSSIGARNGTPRTCPGRSLSAIMWSTCRLPDESKTGTRENCCCIASPSPLETQMAVVRPMASFSSPSTIFWSPPDGVATLSGSISCTRSSNMRSGLGSLDRIAKHSPDIRDVRYARDCNW
jgi:hypothetical protein